MNKLFLTLMLVAGLMFGGISGCVSQTGMNPDIQSMPGMEYAALDFFNDGKPYFVPKHIKVQEAIWMHDLEKLTDDLRLMHYIAANEVVTFVVNVKEMTVLAVVYNRAGFKEFYIYDSKPYPVKVTELTVETYINLQIERETT